MVGLSKKEKATLSEFLGELRERAESMPAKPLDVWLGELQEHCLLTDQLTERASLARARAAWLAFHEATMRGAERNWPDGVVRLIECVRQVALTTAVRAYGQAVQDQHAQGTLNELWRQIDEQTRARR